MKKNYNKKPEYPAKLGISGPKGANNYYDKNTIHLPRQESGVQVISWHSADTWGHNYPKAECGTMIRLRMRNGKITISQ